MSGLRRVAGALLSALSLAPVGWPHHLVLGLTDPSGDARALVARTHLDARYQYLAGGVNTGQGWSTWNPHGTFASMYARESLAAHVIPVVTYYQLLQSRPSAGSDELARDLSNLRNGATMRAYWADFSLLMRRIAAAAGRHTVIVHVEPDLWGYLQQANAGGLARGFAHHLGNTFLNNSWTHYRDDRVQWWLGSGSAAHLRATRDAGVIGLLFGGGATGTTGARSDGGLFYRLARAYERHPLGL